jgi:hypothetical protein
VTAKRYEAVGKDKKIGISADLQRIFLPACRLMPYPDILSGRLIELSPLLVRSLFHIPFFFQSFLEISPDAYNRYGILNDSQTNAA